MNGCYEFWDDVFNEINEKYVAEASEMLYRHSYEEIEFHEIIVDKRSLKPSLLRTVMSIAAAVMLLIGGGFLISKLFGSAEIPVLPSEGTGKYDTVSVIYSQDGKTADITLTTDSTDRGKAERLIELLENAELKETELVPVNHEETYYEISLCLDGNVIKRIRLEYCYDHYKVEDNVHCFYITDDKTYEISEEVYNSVGEILSDHISLAFAVPKSGNYYLDGDPARGVYITVDSDAMTIALNGRNALDFIREEERLLAGEEVISDKTAERAQKKYNDYAESEFELNYADITLYIISLKGKDCVYHYNGGDTIMLYGREFLQYGKTEQLKFEGSYRIGEIRFTEVSEIDILGINSVSASFENEETATEYFKDFTGCNGIERIGGSVIGGYKSDIGKSCWNSLYETNGSAREANLYFDNGYGGELLISAAEYGNTSHLRIYDKQKSLIFSDENIVYSELKTPDGGTVKLKIGGINCKGSDSESGYYLIAEWTDKNNISYSVTGRKCTLWDFLNTVIAVVCDVDGVSDVVNGYTELCTDLSSYTMDMNIFYNSFRGIWSNGEAELDIGWNDNVFNFYENECIGFYEDELGAYMAGEYGLWFIPSDESERMYHYNVSLYNDEPVIASDYESFYTKKATGDVNGYEGEYGYLGLQELCSYMEISFDDLYNLEITDENGVVWERTPSKFGISIDGAYVSKRERHEIILHLNMVNKGQYASGEAPEIKFFSFRFIDAGPGFRMTDEHYPYDPTILLHEAYPSGNTREAFREAEEYSEYGCYMVISADFYPLSDGTYYAVRTAGTNQAQWVNRRDIYYYNGTDYLLITDSLTGIMGRIEVVQDNDRLYVLSGIHHEDDSKDFILSCFVGSEQTASVTLDKGYHYFHHLLAEGDRVVCLFETDASSGKYVKYHIYFEDPYNPVVVSVEDTNEHDGMTDLTQEPVYGYAVLTNAADTAVSDALRKAEGEISYVYTNPIPEISGRITVENTALRAESAMIVTDADGSGFKYGAGYVPRIMIKPDYSPDYSEKEGEQIAVGYIENGIAINLYRGILPPEGITMNYFGTNNEVSFYIVNLSENNLLNIRRAVIADITAELEETEEILSEDFHNESVYLLEKYDGIFISDATERTEGEAAFEILKEEIGVSDVIYPIAEKYRSEGVYYGKYYCPAEEGGFIYSMTDGIVEDTGYEVQLGRYVIVRIAENKYILYAHLKEYYVNEGVEIKKGYIIGTVGNSGMTSEHALEIKAISLGS